MDGFTLDAAEVPVLRCTALSDIPGLAHGFSTRVGSGATPFDLGPADAGPAFIARRRTFSNACGVLGDPLVLRQVHGSAVVVAAEVPEGSTPEADAAVWLRGGRPPAVRTADCVAILLADREGRAAAAVHAGWRGTAAGIAGATVSALASRGIAPGGLVAALGPAILGCCYEVGPDVRAALGSVSGHTVDLHLCLRRQLEAAGVPGSAIHAAPWCTRCRPDLFFSHRREKDAAGRMMAVIGGAVALTPAGR